MKLLISFQVHHLLQSLKLSEQLEQTPIASSSKVKLEDLQFRKLHPLNSRPDPIV